MSTEIQKEGGGIIKGIWTLAIESVVLGQQLWHYLGAQSSERSSPAEWLTFQSVKLSWWHWPSSLLSHIPAGAKSSHRTNGHLDSIQLALSLSLFLFLSLAMGHGASFNPSLGHIFSVRCPDQLFSILMACCNHQGSFSIILVSQAYSQKFWINWYGVRPEIGTFKTSQVIISYS